ncbi:MAG: hypothetical protein HFJ30_00435 [Clostridia bacterium]|jgi:hypothetical protein|nr:hypothetical protein [Clostridia bacterium]
MRYIHITTNETIEEDEALDYAMKKCGLQFTDNYNSQEREEFKEMFIEWFFSGNYIEEDDEEDIPNLERDLEIADMIYQQNLDKKWGIA